MDSLKGRREGAKAQPGSRKFVFEEIKPSAEWSHTSNSHILRIGLPGFTKEDLKVQVDSSGKLTVKGKRQVTDSTFHSVEQVFEVPADANIDQISGKLDDGHLTLFMPKKERAEPAPPTKITGNLPEANKECPAKREMEKVEQNGDDWQMESSRKKEESLKEKLEEVIADTNGLKDKLLEKINQNRKVIAVAVVAFSVGFYVSRKLRSRG